MKFRKTKPTASLAKFFQVNFDEHNLWEYKADEVDLLAELVALIRPKKLKNLKKVDLSELLILLEDNEKYRDGLALYLKMILKNKKFSKILTDAGILTDTDFFHEVKKRLF